MKVHDFEQYSPEWYSLHIGRPSASKFHLIITPKKLEPTKGETRKKYKWRLVAERLLNKPLESDIQTEWMERGLDLEPSAANAFEFLHEKKLSRVGLITTDDCRIIASPDRIINGENGGVEIKCRSHILHIGMMDEGFGADYIVQRMGQLWIAEWDFAYGFAYNPLFPSVETRIDKSEDDVLEKMQKVSDAVRFFADEVDSLYDRIKRMGYYSPEERTPTPHDVELEKILNAG